MPLLAALQREREKLRQSGSKEMINPVYCTYTSSLCLRRCRASAGRPPLSGSFWTLSKPGCDFSHRPLQRLSNAFPALFHYPFHCPYHCPSSTFPLPFLDLPLPFLDLSTAFP